MNPQRKTLKPTTNCHRKFQNRLCVQKGNCIGAVSNKNIKGTLTKNNPMSNEVTLREEWEQYREDVPAQEITYTEMNKKPEYVEYEYYIYGHVQRFTTNSGIKIDKSNSSECKYYYFALRVNRCRQNLSSNTLNDQWEFPDLTWYIQHHPVCIRFNDCIPYLWDLRKWINYFHSISSVLHRAQFYICLSYVPFLPALREKASNNMSKCVKYIQLRKAVFYLQRGNIYNVLNQDITHHIEKAITYFMSKIPWTAIWTGKLFAIQSQVWNYFVDTIFTTCSMTDIVI